MAGIIALTLLIRAPFFSWPLTVDEGSYAYTAQWWFRGLTLYTPDLWFDRPQAIFLAYGLGMKLLGDATWAIRLWGALWAAATTFGIYLIAEQLWDRRAGMVAAFLSAIFSAAPHVEGFTSNGEVFMLLPATFSAYCLLTKRPVWAGVLASGALLLKPSGIMAVVLGVTWLACARTRWRECFIFCLAIVPLPLLSVLHAASTAGLGAYLDAIIWYRLGVNVATGYQPEGSALVGWAQTLSVWGPLAMPTMIGIARSRGRNLAFILLWLGTSVAGVAMGGHWLMHYFMQLVPPLAAVAGGGLAGLLFANRRVLRGLAVAVAATGLTLFISLDGPYFFRPALQGSRDLYGRPGYQVSGEIAAYLRQHADVDDTLYVGFYEAELYYLTGMRSTTPYLFRLDLLFLPGAYESVVRDIVERKPDFVLDLRQPLGGNLEEGRFHRALDEGYQFETTFDGVMLYRRR